MLGADGDPRAEVWCVGRDYGETEQRLGLPFQGAAGSVLNKALLCAGLQRERCFITNVVNQRPAGNKWELHAPETVKRGLAELHGLLAEHQPRVVVPLGNEAFRAVMRVSPDDAETLPSITEARGYIWEGWWGASNNAARIVPAIHPAAALREWVPSRVLLDLDLRRAADEWRAGCVALPARDVRFVTDEFEAKFVRAMLLKAKRLAVDIENYDSKRLACMGFATSAETAWVVPAFAAWQVELIREVCESEVEKVLQNGAYDRYFLKSRCGISLRAQRFDTLLGWHCLQPELAGQAQEKRGSKRSEKSLRFLVSLYCRSRFYKDYAFQSERERWELCGLDCMHTFEIAEKLGRELEAA